MIQGVEYFGGHKGGGSGNANIDKQVISLVANVSQNVTVTGATTIDLIDVIAADGTNLKGEINILIVGNVATLTAYDDYANLKVNSVFS